MYKINTVDNDDWARLAAALGYVAAHNDAIVFHEILEPGDGDTHGYVIIRSSGHDRAAITRKIIRPIRAIFIRAKLPTDKVQVVSSSIRPTGRSLSLEEGRTPKNTFTPPMLRDMLADHGATLEPGI